MKKLMSVFVLMSLVLGFSCAGFAADAAKKPAPAMKSTKMMTKKKKTMKATNNMKMANKKKAPAKTQPKSK